MRILCSSGNDSCLYVAVKDIVVALDLELGSIQTLACHRQMSPVSSSGTIDDGITAQSEDVESAFVISATYCYENTLCVVYADKAVRVFDVRTGNVVSTHVLPKRPVALTSASINEVGKVILIADKAAEVWGLDLPRLHSKVRMLGHTASIITDLRINDGCSILVTSDRDEKIRISRFPQTALIESYCLGHTSVVTSIDFISIKSRQLLVSTGWDYKIILWNHIQGEILAELILEKDMTSWVEMDPQTAKKDVQSGDCTENDEKNYDQSAVGNFPMRVIAFSNTEQPMIAVIFKGLRYIKIFPLNFLSNTYEFGKEMTVHFEAPPCDVVFMENGLLVAILASSTYLQVVNVSYEAGREIYAPVEKGINNVFEQFRDLCMNRAVEFEQVLDFSTDASSENVKMKKHAIDEDKRFCKDRLSSRYAASKFSKKRQKRPSGEEDDHKSN